MLLLRLEARGPIRLLLMLPPKLQLVLVPLLPPELLLVRVLVQMLLLPLECEQQDVPNRRYPLLGSTRPELPTAAAATEAAAYAAILRQHGYGRTITHPRRPPAPRSDYV